MVSRPLVPSRSVHEYEAVPSVLVVRAAIAADVATAVIGEASVDAVPAPPTIVIPPREVVPSHSVNVVVDGTVWTIQLEPVVGVVP